MTHHEIRNRLDAYIDGELASQERAAIDAHLTRCRECEAAVAHWRAISSAFFRPEPVGSTDHAVTRIMARIRELNSVPAGGFFGAWRWTALALGLAAFGLLATLPTEDAAPTTRELLLDDRGASFVAAVPGDGVDDILTVSLEEI